MARLALNKSTLHARQHELATFRRFLPSLELKRRQLMAKRAEAREQAEAARGIEDAIRAEVHAHIPMAAYEELDLEGLRRIREVRIGRENVVGTPLPVLEAVEMDATPYGLLSRPHWVDDLAEGLERALEANVASQVAEERLALLEDAVKRITQRVNLFDKVLIPSAKKDIHRIRIHLADAEREAVVRAKMAKSKLTRASAAENEAAPEESAETVENGGTP